MFELRIRPFVVGRMLVCLFAVLLLAHIAVVVLRLEFGRDYIYGLALRFDFDRPISAPDWFTGVLFLAAALSSAMCGLATGHGWERGYWFGISGILAFLSFDEVASIHAYVATLFGQPAFVGWTLIYAPAVGLLAVGALPLLLRLPRPTAVGLVVSGLLFTFGAVAMEWFGASIAEAATGTPVAEMTKTQWTEVKNTWPYVASAMLEESFEMCALILYVVTALTYVSRQKVEFRLSFG